MLCWKKGYYVISELSNETGFSTKLSTGQNHACALKNQQILCMGRSDYGQATPPSGNFVDISCGNRSTCAIDVNGKIHCFGKHYVSNRFVTSPPNGTFVEVHVGPGTQACAVSSIGEIHCWGLEEFDENQVHSGPFIHVNVHLYGYCGTYTNLTVECFGQSKVFQDLALSTQFLEISIGIFDACGVENATNLLLCETVGRIHDVSFLPNDFEVYIAQ
jgi:alpha-tubulin suppressor-like RCC1 family protein